MLLRRRRCHSECRWKAQYWFSGIVGENSRTFVIVDLLTRFSHCGHKMIIKNVWNSGGDWPVALLPPYWRGNGGSAPSIGRFFTDCYRHPATRIRNSKVRLKSAQYSYATTNSDDQTDRRRDNQKFKTKIKTGFANNIKFAYFCVLFGYSVILYRNCLVLNLAAWK